MEIDQALLFTDAQQWRNWLEQNYAKEKDAWLIHYKKNSGKISLSYPEALDEALSFGWIDSRLKSLDTERYVLKYSPRRPKSPWSKSNKERAEKLIQSGKMTSAGMAKIEEAKKNGYWDAAYTSKKADEISEDLEKALRKNDAAWNNFRNFANSYRNMYIGWINNAKTEVTRQRRIAEVVERSAQNKKPEGVGAYLKSKRI